MKDGQHWLDFKLTDPDGKRVEIQAALELVANDKLALMVAEGREFHEKDGIACLVAFIEKALRDKA